MTLSSGLEQETPPYRVNKALAIGILFSALGDGASQRATNWTWFVRLAFVGFWLLQGRSRGAPAMES